MKQQQLIDKVIVVTGASAGIGAAMVRVFAQAGANVVLVARRVEKLTSLAVALDGYTGKRMVLAGDLQDADFCEQIVKETVAEFGRIDILINNAGLGHRTPLSQIPLLHMQTIVATNIFALLLTSQAAITQMRLQGSGQIINVSSIVGQRPLLNAGFYCASKAAVNFINRSLRMELRQTPIIITSLYPGMTDTNFHEAILGEARQRGWRGVSAEKVARATLYAIQKQRTEVYVTPVDWLFTHLNRLFPRLTDALAARLWQG